MSSDSPAKESGTLKIQSSVAKLTFVPNKVFQLYLKKAKLSVLIHQ